MPSSYSLRCITSPVSSLLVHLASQAIACSSVNVEAHGPLAAARAAQGYVPKSWSEKHNAGALPTEDSMKYDQPVNGVPSRVKRDGRFTFPQS